MKCDNCGKEWLPESGCGDKWCSRCMKNEREEKKSFNIKFRKKPVVIEAVQLTWSNWNRICDFVSTPWFVSGCYLGDDMKETTDTNGRLGLVIRTMESNEFIAQENDWIIKGVSGEFYACKPDIFEKTYEVAN